MAGVSPLDLVLDSAPSSPGELDPKTQHQGSSPEESARAIYHESIWPKLNLLLEGVQVLTPEVSPGPPHGSSPGPTNRPGPAEEIDRDDPATGFDSTETDKTASPCGGFLQGEDMTEMRSNRRFENMGCSTQESTYCGCELPCDRDHGSEVREALAAAIGFRRRTNALGMCHVKEAVGKGQVSEGGSGGGIESLCNGTLRWKDYENTHEEFNDRFKGDFDTWGIHSTSIELRNKQWEDWGPSGFAGTCAWGSIPQQPH